MKVKKINEFLDKKQKVIVVVMAPTIADKQMGHEALQYIKSLLTDKAKVNPDTRQLTDSLVCSYARNLNSIDMELSP